MIDSAGVRRNLDAVKERISAAAVRAGRDPAQIRLVVVTKGHPAEVIPVLANLGVTDLGESFAEEGRAKQGAMASLPAVKWHMIGHVQSRKARLVAEYFDLVHSVDSLKLARRLDRFAGQVGRALPVLLECNVSADVRKSGWLVARERELDKFFDDAQEIVLLPNLRVKGLMSIAPLVDKPHKAKPYFAQARELRDDLVARFPQAQCNELSMGMSSDFEAAISEGATLVRIGTAILGPRGK